MRGCIALVVVAVLLAACGGGRPDEPPALRLRVGDELVEGQRGRYCWMQDVPRGGTCVDTIQPEPSFFHVLARSEIVLRPGDPRPDEIRLALVHPDTNATVESTALADISATERWRPDAPPGRYWLHAFSRWDKLGDASYVFGVELP